MCRGNRDLPGRIGGRRTALAARLSMAMAVAPALSAVLAPATAHADEAGISLHVTVSGIRSDHGHIRLAVCTQRSFLSTSCPFTAAAPARSGSVTLVVAGIDPGTYAVQVFQDEDDSGHIKQSMLGIPEEGVGFSNDAVIQFGPPRFTDAAFRLAPGGGEQHLHLRLQYFE